MPVTKRNVNSLAKSGSAKLKGDVTLTEGSNVTLTQSGNNIEVAATGSGGAPTDATYIVQTANGSLSAEQALGALATGIVKNTTTTGVLSIAAQGTDYYAPSGTDVAVADGGTGASTAAGALTNLGLTATATELNYTDGVTSAIQTQLDGKNSKIYYTVGSANADYITDGTADDVQIQQAIDAAEAAGGGTVHIKEGAYDIAATLTVGNNIILQGDAVNDVNYASAGGGTKLIRAAALDAPMITNADTSGGNHDIVIKDMFLNGNYASGTPSVAAKGIYFTKGQRSLFYNLYIGNCKGDGITIDGTGGGANQIAFCKIRGNQKSGIQLGSGGASDCQIVNCEIGSNAQDGIILASVADCIINNNIIYLNTSDGIELFNSSKCIVIGNRINTNGANGIKLTGSSATPAYCTVMGNFSYNNGQSTTGSGISVSDSSVGARYNNIVGNICYDNQGTPTQDYGILTANNSDYQTITNNICVTNQTGQVSVVGSNNILFNNVGHTTNYINGTASPVTTDAGALGTSSLMWSDLFLASGAVINFNNGDVTITHAADKITIAGGDLEVPDEVYGVGWNGSTEVPTKNAVYDKIEAIPALTDGDKGDLTLSSSGTVWTIDNGVVTYAKMQDVSATSRILGRITAAAGDVEELTDANVFTILGITSTAAELNILDGVTSTAAELNILDGVTSTAAELNILDGATLTVTELNYVDGVTSAIQTQLDAKQASDAELTAIAGLTSAADKGIQFTGSGTAATYDLTAAGKALLDDASAAAQRTTLGITKINALTKSLTIESPTNAEDISFFYTPVAITITELVAVSVGSSPSVTYTVRHHTDRSNAGNEVVTSGSTTTSTTTGDIVTSFNDATIPADSFVWIETTAKSGTVTSTQISLQFTED